MSASPSDLPVGQAATVDPAAYFHIVSKHTGFDPLIEHLKSRGLRVRRHEDFSSLTFSAPGKAPSTLRDLPLDRAIEQLRRNPNNRPKRKKTLVSYLKSLLGKSVPESAPLDLVGALENAGHLTLGEKDMVSYRV